MDAFYLAMQMAILIFGGAFARRIRIVDERFAASMSSLLMNIMIPCQIMTVINGGDLTPDALRTSGTLVGLSIVVLVLLLAAGTVYTRLAFKSQDGFSRSTMLAMVFTNFTFMGFPVVEGLYGADGLFAFMLFTLPMRVFLFVLPPFVLASNQQNAAKRPLFAHLRPLLAPSVLAVPVALLLFALGINLPTPLRLAMKQISDACGPMGMLLCGVSLATIRAADLTSDKRMFASVVGRNLVAPAVILLVLCVVPIDSLLLRTAVMYAALPTGSFMGVFALQYDAAPAQTSAQILLSTLLSIATLPLWVALLEWVVAVQA